MIRGAILPSRCGAVRALRLLRLLRRADLVPAQGRPARGLSAGVRSGGGVKPNAVGCSFPSPRRSAWPTARSSRPRPIRQTRATLNAAKTEPWPGAPLEPIGDPLLAGVGPGSWAVRPDVPYKTAEGDDLIAPLRVATNFAVAADGGNPLGFTVIGGDRRAAGTVKDLWVDRSESVLRYYEIALESAKSVLVPVHFADVNFRARTINDQGADGRRSSRWSRR